MDNNISDNYFYQITVQTGGRREAETASKIFFIINGEKSATPLRILCDKENTVCFLGSICFGEVLVQWHQIQRYNIFLHK